MQAEPAEEDGGDGDSQVDELVIEEQALAGIAGLEADDEQSERSRHQGRERRILDERGKPIAHASDLLDLRLAEQPGRPEDQHQDEDGEHRDVLVLAREVAGPEDLDQTDQQTTQHGAR